MPNSDDATRTGADPAITNSLTDTAATNPLADPAVTTGGDVAPGAGQPPTTTARYLVGDEIARGGMGVVYRATDTAFGRTVAVKVLRTDAGLRSSAGRRFADEARITAQLQHPNIPAVHDLGVLPDGRPFLAMKLIQGDTLEEQLKQRPDPATDRGRFVAAFEQLCQGMAYAHAHGVIHRDLKPANVMVGAFGEVQVMDWGLAKVLGTPRTAPDTAGGDTAVQNLRDSDADGTQAGSVLGTPAYMPPEQAAGTVDQVGARSDVFGLGGILAAVLTGRPPFQGDSAEATRRKAARGQVQECFARLDGCGADPELVTLCKRCLSADPADRPADAGIVAGEVARLRAAADERARRAEGERAAAEVRAAAEAQMRRAAEEKEAERRKRRRVQALLALCVALLLAAGGGFGWYRDRQTAAERGRLGRNAEAVAGLLDRVEAALRAGDPAGAAGDLESADARATEGGADQLSGRRDALAADLMMLRALDEADRFRWTPVEGRAAGKAGMLPRYRAALAAGGADPGAVEPAEAAARIATSSIRDRLVTALDRLLVAERSGRVRAGLRAADPDEYRDAVRDAVLAGDDARVRDLACGGRAVEQPAGFATVLGESSVVPVNRQRELLAAALGRRPGDLGLLVAIGLSYPPNTAEGASERLRWYQAAVAVAPANPAVHNLLGSALRDGKEIHAAIACYREAIRLDPVFAPVHYNLGIALRDRKEIDAAIACYRESIRLDPTLASAHLNLGTALRDKGEIGAAVACFREAIRLDPASARAHNGLGMALRVRGELDAAVASLREAVRLNPGYAPAHTNLGNALLDRKEVDAAVACFREAIRLNPASAFAHYNLGNVLYERKDFAAAIVCYREALRCDPDLVAAHANLGNVLRDRKDLDAAAACYREVLRLDPKHARAHGNLGWILEQKGDFDAAVAAYREALRLDPKYAYAAGRLPQAERTRALLGRLPAVLAGTATPATPAEACEFARLCARPYQSRFAAAVRLYEGAFAADPKLAADTTAGHRYDAACYAARAARGDGMDAPTDAAGRAALRAQALVWLRADLAARQKQAASAKAADRQAAATKLTLWLSDSDLSGLRPGPERVAMPAGEESSWDALWADVRTAIAAARRTPPPLETAPPPRSK